MISFYTFWLLNEATQGVKGFFEIFLTYYVLKRILYLFFFHHSENYDVEICSCEDLSLRKIYHSKIFKFRYNRNRYNNAKLKKFFFRNMLKRKCSEWKSDSTDIARCISPEVVKRNEWNIFLLKLLYSNFKRMKKKKKWKDEESSFSLFSSFLLSLFHYENYIIKTSDKLPLLVLLFFSCMKKNKKKELIRMNSRYVYEGGKLAHNSFISKRHNSLHDIFMNLKKIKINEKQKLVESHLLHIHVFKNIEETENGKKKVLMLCKKSLRFLANICTTYLKSYKGRGRFRTVHNIYSTYTVCNFINKKEFLKMCSLCNRYNTVVKRKDKRFIGNVKGIENGFIFYICRLLKDINTIKFLFKEQICNRIILFLIKQLFYHSSFKRYIGVFYSKLFFRPPQKNRIIDKILVERYQNKFKGIFCNQKDKYHSEKLTKKSGFFLICAYICLLHNSSNNNIYYLIVRLLFQNKNIYFYNQLNYFTEQLIKKNPKLQYLWNLKKMLFCFYVNVYLKKRQNYWKKKYVEGMIKTEKEKNIHNNTHFSSGDLFFSLNVLSCSKKYRIKKDRQKKKIVCIKKYVRISHWKSEEHKKWESKRKHIKLLLIDYTLNYHFSFTKKKKSNKGITLMENISNYYKDNLNFLNQALSYKSHNYMPVSFIFLLYNYFFYFSYYWKNIYSEEIERLIKTLQDKNLEILLRHIYYYALHHVFLMIYMQRIYYVVTNYLKSFYFIKYVKNMYTSSFFFWVERRNCFLQRNISHLQSKKKYLKNSNFNKKRSNLFGHCNFFDKKKNLGLKTLKENSKSISIEDLLNKEYIYIKTTYLDFYLFSKKEGKCAMMTSEQLCDFYQKINNSLKNYEENLKELIKLLNTYYVGSYYIYFYTDAVKNVLYCFCSSTFFFKELFCNIVIPLLFYNAKFGKNELPGSILTESFRSLDNRLRGELKFLKKFYKFLRGKEKERCQKNDQKQKELRIKEVHPLLRMAKRNIYSQWKQKNGVRKKSKVWIICKFCIFSFNEYSNVLEIGNSYEKREKKKKYISLKNAYFIFFRCIINVIHEHVLHIYYCVHKYFYKESFSSVDYMSKEKRRSNIHNLTKIITFSNENKSSLIQNISHSNKWKEEATLIKKNCRTEHFKNNGKNDASFRLFPFRFKNHLHFLYRIYYDISFFLKIFKKSNFVFFYIIRYFVKVSNKIKKKVHFLKFFFTLHFILYLFEHVHTFYLIKEIKNMLKEIFDGSYFINTL